ncbi:MAG: DUF11 domain-containing protein, partial [Pirellulales bacterium]|nr:DUF11 domain-containing protein [Pirellulales bacterium]
MTQKKKTRSKKTLMIRLAAAAFVVAGVATAAKFMRPKSNAADSPIVQENAPPTTSETTAETKPVAESKPAVVTPKNTEKVDAESMPANPFDTSAVANAFASKPSNFDEPKPFKPAADVRPVQHEEPAEAEPLNTIPPVAEVESEAEAPLPKNPFGPGSIGPTTNGGSDESAPPPGNFGPTNAASEPAASAPPTAAFGASPRFGAGDTDVPSPSGAKFDTRELPSKETGVIGDDTFDPPSSFGADRRTDQPYVEPRPLRGVGESAEGRGVPGTKKLEGVQSPSLTVEKIAPAEIQVGKPATFEVVVTNTSQVTAHNVRLIDEVPRGTKLVETTPRAETSREGDVVWSLGDLGPDQQATVKMQLMPTSQGESGSVATVEFAARASAKTIAT